MGLKFKPQSGGLSVLGLLRQQFACSPYVFGRKHACFKTEFQLDGHVKCACVLQWIDNLLRMYLTPPGYVKQSEQMNELTLLQ